MESQVSAIPGRGPSGPVAATLLAALLRGYDGEVGVRLWDGRWIHGDATGPCTVVFRQPGAVRALVSRNGLLAAIEAYLAGDVDIEGDAVRVGGFASHLADRRFGWTDALYLASLAWRLPSSARPPLVRQAHRANDHQTIGHHYDVSNAFYRLWLDPEMVYSCAYFHDADQSLAEAQRDKLDYLCRKLRLRPGHTLLDIGCGWGGLACWAARHYGVTVHGITLSRQQWDHACRQVERQGLGDRVTIACRDYRDLPRHPTYDRVVSVGMVEHVGLAALPGYFRVIRQVLRPDGLLLCHGITNEAGWQRNAFTRFMNGYVFPDAELTRLSEMTRFTEAAGLEILDVESLRRHYALTLRHWVSRLESTADDARALVGDATYRLWRLYMAGSAAYFDQGDLNVYQILASPAHHGPAVPLRRDDLYR